MLSETVQVLEENMGEMLYSPNGKGFSNVIKNQDATKARLVHLTAIF